MRDKDDLGNIPPLVPDRDDVSSHQSNRRAQSRDIVPASHKAGKYSVSTWPVRFMLFLLTAAVVAGVYGAWYFYTDVYQAEVRQANLRITDLENRLALMGESAEETDNTLMEDINQTIEQYDLLWANWRENNRQFEDIQSEIARLKQVNEGQDEIVSNNSQQLAQNSEALNQANARINSMSEEVAGLDQSLSRLDASVQNLASLRADIESISQSVNSGDTSLLGLAGRVEYVEESMESVNAHRLQINESLFRLQEDIEALQRSRP